MTPTPSVAAAKEGSILSASTTTAPPAPSTGCRSSKSAAAFYYPTNACGRTPYLILRSLIFLNTVVQIVCASVAAGRYGHPHWLDPSLSPALATFFYSGIDILDVVGRQRRSHYLGRALYDGALAIGFAIAAGFFLHMALPFMNGSASATMPGDDADVGALGVLGAILVYCMFSNVIAHSIICAEGVRDTIKIRREARLQASEVAAV